LSQSRLPQDSNSHFNQIPSFCNPVRRGARYALVIGLFTTPALGQESGTALDFSGTWEQEWAYATEEQDSQKFEALIDPRWDIELRDDMRLTIVNRIRLDTVGELGPEQNRPDTYSNINGAFYNDAHVEFGLREFYLDTDWGRSSWRLGKQQVVWGQADGIKVLDVVNPQSFREFIVDEFDDSRIPLWMVNVELPVSEDGTLQLLWIPDTSYHELAEQGTPFFLTSPRLVPQTPPGLDVSVLSLDKPDDFLADSDVGARFSTFLSGWDITLNYLFHYQDFPVFYQELFATSEGIEGVVTPEYERNHLLGSTLSNVFGDLTLRVELGYNTDTFHISSDFERRGIGKSDEVASVVGIDWQFGSDSFLSGQWFQSYLADYESSMARDRTEQNLSLLYRQFFRNETWQLTALGLYSPNHEDSWVQLKLQHALQSNLEIWLGGDFFQGDRDGLFGQFSRQDRVLLGLRYGF
jgi:hypothetical protein